MKSFITAIIMLFLICSASLGISAYSDKKIDKIISLTNTIKNDGAKSDTSKICIEEAMEVWEKNESLFHITINRNDIIVVKKEIASALGASRANSADDFLIATERLAVTLDNIKGYTECRLENIF